MSPPLPSRRPAPETVGQELHSTGHSTHPLDTFDLHRNHGSTPTMRATRAGDTVLADNASSVPLLSACKNEAEATSTSAAKLPESTQEPLEPLADASFSFPTGLGRNAYRWNAPSGSSVFRTAVSPAASLCTGMHFPTYCTQGKGTVFGVLQGLQPTERRGDLQYFTVASAFLECSTRWL